MRVTSSTELAGCSPDVRAQLERALGGVTAMQTAAAAAGIDLKPRGKTRSGRPEQDAGAQLVQWIDLLVLPDGTRPGALFCHVANGGGRSAVEAGILKGQGVRAGWPDYTLDLPRGRFHGLRLELKAPEGGKPTSEQLDILDRLQKAGYQVAVAWGFTEAKAAIETYLKLGDFPCVTSDTPAAP